MTAPISPRRKAVFIPLANRCTLATPESESLEQSQRQGGRRPRTPTVTTSMAATATCMATLRLATDRYGRSAFIRAAKQHCRPSEVVGQADHRSDGHGGHQPPGARGHRDSNHLHLDEQPDDPWRQASEAGQEESERQTQPG